MGVTKSAVVAVPATMLVMSAVVQGVSQASSAIGRGPDEAASRIHKAELTIGAALVVAAALSGDMGAVIATGLTVGVTYAIYDRLVLR